MDKREIVHTALGRLEYVQILLKDSPAIQGEVTQLIGQTILDLCVVLGIRKVAEPTTNEPDWETLQEWMFDGVCEAVDGCYPIELDGHCEHGAPSWFLYLGLI